MPGVGLPKSARIGGNVYEFRVSDYGEFTEGVSGNYHFRGYTFEVTEEIDVTHLIGGGVNTLAISIATATGTTTVDSILATEQIVGDNVEKLVELATPVTLEPGQTYIIAQGSSNSASKHYVMDSINVGLLEENPLIVEGSWSPSNGTQAYVWGSALSGSGSLTPHKPRIGFKYE